MRRDIKDDILRTTIRLIEETGDRPEKITVRDICGAAGVGISQINYHFQTKDNLIAQCVQVLIGDVIARFPKSLEQSAIEGEPAADTLKRMMLSTLRYLYTHENISRISILSDHQAARPGDNTAQTIAAYLPLAQKVCRERGLQDDPHKLMTMMVLTMQGVFLRTDAIKDALGMDLRDEEQRRKLLEDYVESAFRRA